MFDTIYKTFSSIDKNIDKPLALIIISSPFWYIIVNIHSHWSVEFYGKDFAAVLAICLGLMSTLYLLGAYFISEAPYFFDEKFIEQSIYTIEYLSFSKSIRPYIFSLFLYVYFFSAEFLLFNSEKEEDLKNIILRFMLSGAIFYSVEGVSSYIKWFKFKKKIKKEKTEEVKPKN